MTAAVGGISFPEIPISQLNDASWNARKSFDEVALQELAASIREHGVQVPLIVREVTDPDLDPKLAIRERDRAFEIVAGHRRFRAAQRIGLETLPCIVRDLDEDEAREIGLVDNLQRENVPAMEEAVAFSELLTRAGSIEAVAARVQKDQAYVAKRLKLCSLSLAGQDALRHRLITVDHALVLARLGPDEQDAALKWSIDRHAGVKVSVDKVIEDRVARQQKAQGAEKDSYRWRQTWEPATVQALKDHIASESGIVLDRAPWDLDQPEMIPDAPACNACPQNTKANAPLFGDLEIGEAKCTDGGCFREKTQAFVRLQARICAAPDEAKVPLRVSWKATSTAPRLDKETGAPSLTQVFKAGQWTEAKKKSCEHVQAAVTVDWSDAGERGYMGSGKKLRKPGEIIQVCVEPKCKAHPKDWAKPAKSSQREERVSEEDTKKLAEQREFLQKTENALRRELLYAILEKLELGAALRAVADTDEAAPEWRKFLLARLPKLSGDHLEALTLFCCQFDQAFRTTGYWLLQDCRLNKEGYFEAAKERPNVARDRKEAWALAKQARVDADAIAVRHFAAVGIAPAADVLYPKGPKAEKAWKALQAERAKAKSAAPAKTSAKPAAAKKLDPQRVKALKKRVRESVRAAAAKKGGRK